MRKIELLAPAKNRESAFAAIDYGADAIYIGASRFGARHAASNSVEDIAAVVEYAHAYGVRVHSTLNTLLFELELKAAEATARELVATGVDALIVQDMAFARMNLGVDLHASTQMCNMTAEGVRFLQECGFSRVVLERALSLKKIEEISAATSVELEAFIHGAICVGHSGRCYLSRSLSERSGNRGECSQPCRLSYDLCDSAGRKIIENSHLLSVRDLNLTAQIGVMLDAGVSSFKIEGRLKDIGYTKNIVAHYRAAIDEQLAQRPDLVRASVGVSQTDFTPNPSKSFTRGESEYLFMGQREDVASLNTPKSIGERLGKIKEQRGAKFKLDGAVELHAGDGICFITPDGLKGTNINSAEDGWFIPNRSDEMAKGVEIFRNFDKRFNDSLERSRTRRRVPTAAMLTFAEGSVKLKYQDCEGSEASKVVEGDFEQPQSEGKMRDVITQQLSKSGDTIFSVDAVEIEGDVKFVPSSLLAQLRREVLAALHKSRLDKYVKPQPFIEGVHAIYPIENLTAEANVTNSVAKIFYLSHGVKNIAEGHDLTADFDEARVMQSSYCIRREIGECLKKGSKLLDELYIERGGARYRLDFDCRKCQMNLICVEKR